MSSILEPQEREAELQSVVNSRTFTKTPGLARLLQYVCNKSLEGRASDLKEYNIGVEALGRPPGFDPTASSIVRVEFHRLREKLKKYYDTEGRHDAVVIVLEPGNYAPRFVPTTEIQSELAPEGTNLPQAHGERSGEETPESSQLAVVSKGVHPLQERASTLPSGRQAQTWTRFRVLLLAVILLACAGGVIAWKMGFLRQETTSSATLGPKTTEPTVSSMPGEQVRILAGYLKSNYIDRSGKVWDGDRYFKGGTALSITRQFIARTLDAGLFQSSRSGDFTYDIPRKPGVYELHLYFVETFFGPGTINGGGEASRIFTVNINGKPLLPSFDLIRDTGANFTADERIFRDVTPAADGYLHLEFTRFRDEPIVTAIELVPGVPGKALPVRIIAQDNSYTDHEGRVWSPDCYFRGGQIVVHKGPVRSTLDSDLYDGERFGNFDYAIPVANGNYTVKLYFAETYFGADNAGGGGDGSRLFDVYCNGIALLRKFDVFKEAGGADRAVVKTFHGLEPNAQGKLLISFVPIENYACINAIEVTQESAER